ncbi:MAG: flagellar export protein FliJ [Syntrophobacteraceae bacterium]
MVFKFRLNSLLKHREFLLREAQGAFGAALSLKMNIESELERVRRDLDRESLQFEQEQRAGIGAGRYLYFKERLSTLEQELQLTYARLEEASTEVERRRQAMVQCDTSVKTLESIETRDRESYRLARVREEQKKLDHAAVQNAHRLTIEKGGNP